MMIGIVTPYKIPNYGTKLQAYAMQKLMSKYDKAELLGFVPSSDYRISSVVGKVYLKINKLIHSKNKQIQCNQQSKRIKAIHSFDQFYHFGPVIKGNRELRNYIKNYKAIVCGSDQLWAPSNVIADYFTLTLVPKDILKFSYAASFGISNIPSNLKNKYKKYISRLDFVSVRENQGKKIITDIMDKDVDVVLDPTLMLDTCEWNALAENSKQHIEAPYIFCYFLGASKEHRQFAVELSKKTGKKIVSIPHFKYWNEADENFGDIQIFEAGPVEFLDLIRNSDYVCTDSFHGTVFSVLFQKRVAIFERFKSNSSESTNSRIYNLVDALGMKKQLVDNINHLDQFIKNEIDYVDVYQNLSILRKNSYAYLDKVFGKKYDENIG